MTVALSTLEDAIHVWAEASTGLSAIWAKQGGTRPASPYVELAATLRTVGQDWLDVSDAGAPAAGAEIVQTARGVRELELTVQCFGAGAVGATSGAGYLDAMISKARLPSHRELLSAAGWTPASFEPVQDISGVIGGSVFEPRARFVCKGFAASEVSETGTYIEIVEITNLTTGDLFTVGA